MTEAEMLLKAIDDNYGQTTPILMLADWNEENGMTDSASMLRSAVGWLGGGGCGYGDGGGDGGGYGDGYGGGGGGGDGIKYILSRGYAMTVEGLYIICSPGGYYPYVRIGWCRRADSMIEMRCCRVIRRFGTDAQLAVIAKDGPISSTQLLDPSDVEYVSVGMVSRLIPCNEKKWRKECPKPATEYVEV